MSISWTATGEDNPSPKDHAVATEQKSSDASPSTDSKDKTSSSISPEGAQAAKPGDKKPDPREAAKSAFKQEIDKLCKANSKALTELTNKMAKASTLDEKKFGEIIDSLPASSDTAFDKASKDALKDLFKKQKENLSEPPEKDLAVVTTASLVACFDGKEDPNRSIIDPKAKQAIQNGQAKVDKNEVDEKLKKALQDKVAALEKANKEQLDKLNQDAKNVVDLAKQQAKDALDTAKNAGLRNAGLDPDLLNGNNNNNGNQNTPQTNQADETPSDTSGSGSGGDTGSGSSGTGNNNSTQSASSPTSSSNPSSSLSSSPSSGTSSSSSPSDSEKKSGSGFNFTKSKTDDEKPDDTSSSSKKGGLADLLGKGLGALKGLGQGNNVADPSTGAGGGNWRKNRDLGPSQALQPVADPSSRLGGYGSVKSQASRASVGTAGKVAASANGGNRDFEGDVFRPPARPVYQSTVGMYNYIKTGPGDWLAANGDSTDGMGGFYESENAGDGLAKGRGPAAAEQILGVSPGGGGAAGSANVSGSGGVAPGIMKQVGSLRKYLAPFLVMRAATGP